MEMKTLMTYDIYGHGRFLPKNRSGPIDTGDIAKNAGAEPHPRSTLRLLCIITKG